MRMKMVFSKDGQRIAEAILDAKDFDNPSANDPWKVINMKRHVKEQPLFGDGIDVTFERS